jgi:hypothetical protein
LTPLYGLDQPSLDKYSTHIYITKRKSNHEKKKNMKT